MIQRCQNPKHPLRKWYYDKGIVVVPEWQIFEGFFKYMGESPFGTYLDRIDNTLGYGPGNVRWATRRQSMTNRSFIRTSLPVGIRKTKVGNYQARIKIYGTEYTVGTYPTLDQAVRERKIWEDMYAV